MITKVLAVSALSLGVAGGAGFAGMQYFSQSSEAPQAASYQMSTDGGGGCCAHETKGDATTAAAMVETAEVSQANPFELADQQMPMSCPSTIPTGETAAMPVAAESACDMEAMASGECPPDKAGCEMMGTEACPMEQAAVEAAVIETP